METNAQIQEFCRRYFQSVDAPILVDQPNFLQIELPREIDKELTDRPYYWMYIEATNQQIPNTVLSLSFDPDLQIEGVDKLEFVTLGSFRLNKLIQSTQKRGRFTRAYQSVPYLTAPALTPVLLTTFKRSFVADRRRDEMISYAVNLLNGHVLRDFYERVEGLAFSPKPSNRVQPLAPTLSLEHGYRLIRERVTDEISSLDHTWAEEADLHLAQEMEQLNTYYESLGLVNNDELKTDEEKAKKAAMLAAERELRISELNWRCAPRIQIEPFHFGLLYVVDGVLGDLPIGTANTKNRLSM